MTKTIDLKPKKSMNRSTIYDFLINESGLKITWTYINDRKYMVFPVPYEWDNSFLLINSVRITDFQSIILFSYEMVVRFSPYGDAQINIPYKDIEYLEIRREMDIGYMALHKGEKIRR